MYMYCIMYIVQCIVCTLYNVDHHMSKYLLKLCWSPTEVFYSLNGYQIQNELRDTKL